MGFIYPPCYVPLREAPPPPPRCHSQGLQFERCSCYNERLHPHSGGRYLPVVLGVVAESPALQRLGQEVLQAQAEDLP